MKITVECPNWEYSTVPGANEDLSARAKSALSQLVSLDPPDQERIAKDTRPIHREYFRGLTPPGFDYYAGHYRGENFPCLVDYEVHVQGDVRVGHTAATVLLEMDQLASDIDDVFKKLALAWSANEKLFGKELKVYRTIELATAVFVYFLEIHPYANGNGHMGRLVLITILARFGIFLRRWPLHPRPPDPPYTQLIAMYRSGNRAPLERFVLSCI